MNRTASWASWAWTSPPWPVRQSWPWGTPERLLRFCLLASQWIGRGDSCRRFRVTGENEVPPHPLLDDIHAASAKPANSKAVHRRCRRRFDDDNFHRRDAANRPIIHALNRLSTSTEPKCAEFDQ